MATGVLPLLLGKYTPPRPVLRPGREVLHRHIRFGFATDTFDAEGTPVNEPQPLTHNLAELRMLAARFHGDMDQVPPIYSAKKINGVPAHKLARAGAEVPVKPARIPYPTTSSYKLLKEIRPPSPCRYPPEATFAP